MLMTPDVAMRKLVAAYACRIAGTRLYGKPLQLLDVERGVSILDHIVAQLALDLGFTDVVPPQGHSPSPVELR